jgi:Flp pilus assembly protein TadD
LEKLGDLDGAESALRLGVERREPLASLDLSSPLHDLARFLERRGDLDGAEAAFRQAVVKEAPSAAFLLEDFLRRHHRE